MALHEANESGHAGYPRVRIRTLGEFALEHLTPPTEPGDPPQYTRVDPREWSSRGPALAMLKVLLCRHGRRAAREELIEAIWPDNEMRNAAHALDSAASVLRRHILPAPGGESLLLTPRSGGETAFRLPGQDLLWVDADEFLNLARGAVRAECQGQDPIPLLEAARALAGGAFLEDDPYAEWVQGRRRTIEGARHRVLYQLVDRYLAGARLGLAEELLFAVLEEDPDDEDALCRLMILLADQGRRREALQLYQYTAEVLQEERSEPAPYTRELAGRLRQGLTLRERAGAYTIHEIAPPFWPGPEEARRALALRAAAPPGGWVAKRLKCRYAAHGE